MLRCIVTLYHRCLKAVTGSADGGRTAAPEGAKTVTWNVIKANCGKAVYKVTDMKFKDPRASDAEFKAFAASVADDINAAFDELDEM